MMGAWRPEMPPAPHGVYPNLLSVPFPHRAPLSHHAGTASAPVLGFEPPLHPWGAPAPFAPAASSRGPGLPRAADRSLPSVPPSVSSRSLPFVPPAASSGLSRQSSAHALHRSPSRDAIVLHRSPSREAQALHRSLSREVLHGSPSRELLHRRDGRAASPSDDLVLRYSADGAAHGAASTKLDWINHQIYLVEERRIACETQRALLADYRHEVGDEEARLPSALDMECETRSLGVPSSTHSARLWMDDRTLNKTTKSPQQDDSVTSVELGRLGALEQGYLALKRQMSDLHQNRLRTNNNKEVLAHHGSQKDAVSEAALRALETDARTSAEMCKVLESRIKEREAQQESLQQMLAKREKESDLLQAKVRALESMEDRDRSTSSDAGRDMEIAKLRQSLAGARAMEADHASERYTLQSTISQLEKEVSSLNARDEDYVLNARDEDYVVEIEALRRELVEARSSWNAEEQLEKAKEATITSLKTERETFRRAERRLKKEYKASLKTLQVELAQSRSVEEALREDTVLLRNNLKLQQEHIGHSKHSQSEHERLGEGKDGVIQELKHELSTERSINDSQAAQLRELTSQLERANLAVNERNSEASMHTQLTSELSSQVQELERLRENERLMLSRMQDADGATLYYKERADRLEEQLAGTQGAQRGVAVSIQEPQDDVHTMSPTHIPSVASSPSHLARRSVSFQEPQARMAELLAANQARMAELLAAKEAAIDNDDFVAAKRIKEEIDTLQREIDAPQIMEARMAELLAANQARMAELLAAKEAAIDNEDFVAAKRIKEEVDTLQKEIDAPQIMVQPASTIGVVMSKATTRRRSACLDASNDYLVGAPAASTGNRSDIEVEASTSGFGRAAASEIRAVASMDGEVMCRVDSME